MASRLHTSGGAFEAQPRTLYPSYFDYDSTSTEPIDSYLEHFDNGYASPMFEGHDAYNAPFHSNHWPTETRVGPAHLANDFDPPSTPTQSFSNPFPTAFNGIIPTNFSAWPENGTQWYSENSSPRNLNPVTAADGSETGISSVQGYSKPEASLTSPATNTKKRKIEPIPLPHSLPRTRRKSGNSEPTKRGLDGRVPGPVIDLTSTDSIRPSKKNSISTASDASFDQARAEEARKSPPGQSESSRRTSSTPDARSRHSQSLSTPQSPLSSPQPAQRARNRTAAIKCRAKTKAATAELDAREKAESLRHQQLMASFRALQAEVFALKSELLLHGNCNDSFIQDYLKNTARSLTVGSGAGVDWAPDAAKARHAQLPR
ncbi:hypothetical protein Daus18300_004001 [Diaporthe australafricana]|uniref:BZIP domain-containing protein n=1 Tax=Diaporthe australafricana TaxID=127596 RepID=A0ABR3XB51_9PEZI